MTTKFVFASLILGTSAIAAASPGEPAEDCEHDTAPAGYGSPSSYDAPDAAYAPTSDPAYSPYTPVSTRPAYEQYPSQYQAPSPYQQPYQRWDRARWHRPVTLASDLQLEGRGRRFIAVGPQAGRFARLELRAQAGRTFIKQVYVQFDDGQEQVMRDIDRTVSRRHGVTLDLDGGRRGIRRIVVYGEGQRTGWSNGSSLSVVGT